MKPSRLLPLSLVTVLGIAIVSCAPPYLVELDKAAAATHRMTAIGTMGPLSPIGNGLSRPKFYPVKPVATSIDAVTVQAAFVVAEDSGTEYLQFAYVDSSGQTQMTSNSSPSFTLTGADPSYPFNQFEVIASTAAVGNVLVYTMNPTAPTSSAVSLYTATLPSGPLALSAGALTLTAAVGAGNQVLGEQVTPTVSGGTDTFNWFETNGTNFAETAPTLSGAANVFNALGATTFNALAVPAVNRFLYYTNGSASYAEYHSGGSWICYKWTPPLPASPVVLAGVTHRIDALLSSGDLLSTEGGTLRLYDATGSQVLSIPMGDLQFCYEAYVGTTPYVFFSLAINLGHGYWAFSVYAVPTSSMRGLGG
jgi:hypothetical protein